MASCLRQAQPSPTAEADYVENHQQAGEKFSNTKMTNNWKLTLRDSSRIKEEELTKSNKREKLAGKKNKQHKQNNLK